MVLPRFFECSADLTWIRPDWYQAKQFDIKHTDIHKFMYDAQEQFWDDYLLSSSLTSWWDDHPKSLTQLCWKHPKFSLPLYAVFCLSSRNADRQRSGVGVDNALWTTFAAGEKNCRSQTGSERERDTSEDNRLSNQHISFLIFSENDNKTYIFLVLENEVTGTNHTVTDPKYRQGIFSPVQCVIHKSDGEGGLREHTTKISFVAVRVDITQK